MMPASKTMTIAKTVANAIVHRKLVVRKNSSWRTEYEPDATHSVNERRLAGQIDLAAEPSDMDVDEVGTRIEMIVPNLLEEHRARDDLVIVPDQMFEQAQPPRPQLEVSRSAARFPRQEVPFRLRYP